MINDAIWQTFADTGDPLCYLLYKKAANDGGTDETNGGEA